MLLLKGGCSVYEKSLDCALMTWSFFCMYIMPPPKKNINKEEKAGKTKILHPMSRIKVRSPIGYVVT